MATTSGANSDQSRGQTVGHGNGTAGGSGQQPPKARRSREDLLGMIAGASLIATFALVMIGTIGYMIFSSK